MKPACFPWSAATLVACVTVLGCDPDLDLPPNPGSNVSLRTERLEVPSDDLAPASPRVSLDYVVYRSVDVLNGERRAPRGVLAFHFGGPGNDNIRSFSSFLSFIAEPILQSLAQNYVVVALNEIGVSAGVASGSQGSVALDCRQRYAPVGLDGEALTAEAQALSSACESEFALLEELTTARAARDLERLRRALGYDELSVYGFGKGASVALAYAAQFPEKAGRIILDSPTDPSRGLLTRIEERAIGLEDAIDRFASWCDTVDNETCPFGEGAAAAELEAWLQELPDDASRARLTQTIVDRLQLELSWPTLGFRLAELRAGDIEFPETVLPPDAFYGYTCGDAPPLSSAELDAFRADLLSSAPRVGPLVVGEPFPCETWPPSEDRLEWGTVLGSLPPVLVTHNALDPRAPFAWASALTAAIPGSVLVSTPEANHRTGLQELNACQNEALAGYLFSGTFPEADVECDAGPTSVLF